MFERLLIRAKRKVSHHAKDLAKWAGKELLGLHHTPILGDKWKLEKLVIFYVVEWYLLSHVAGFAFPHHGAHSWITTASEFLVHHTLSEGIGHKVCNILSH